MSKIPAVSNYEIAESLLGGYFVKYKCPHCHADLKSKQSEIGVPTECPKCGSGYGISRKALKEIERLETAKQLEADRRKQEKLDKAPKCKSCGGPLSFLDRIAGPRSARLCDECSAKQQVQAEQASLEARERKERYLQNLLVTTTPLLDGYRIVDYLGIDGVEVTVGSGLFADLSSRPIISKDNQMIAPSINPLASALPREREPVFPVNCKGITTVWLVGTAHPTSSESAKRLLFVA